MLSININSVWIFVWRTRIVNVEIGVIQVGWGGVLLFIVPLRELMLHKCIYMQQN